MNVLRDSYLVADIDLFGIRNRNEKRVIKFLRSALATFPQEKITERNIMDIYALALNSLSSRYALTGTIVLRDPVKEEDIANAVTAAIKKIIANPKSNI